MAPCGRTIKFDGLVGNRLSQVMAAVKMKKCLRPLDFQFNNLVNIECFDDLL